MTTEETHDVEFFYARVEDLIPYARNSREHSDAQVNQIAASIREFGFLSPVVIAEDKTILAGHGRIMAAQKLGMESVPAVEAKRLTPAQRRAFVLADNRLSETSAWNKEMLANELQDLRVNFPDLSMDEMGFSDVELKDMSLELNLGEPSGTEGKKGLTDPDEVPEVDQNEFGVKRGQVWQLGKHRLMCGDSTSEADVAKLMDGQKADLVFTDPPYGMRLDTNFKRSDRVFGNSYRAVEGDNEDFDPRFIIQSFSKAKEVFIWGADYFHDLLPKKGSFVVWDKRNDELEKAVGNDFELCWSREHHKRLVFRHLWSGITAREKTEKRCHPTQKPIALAEWFFERWGKNCRIIIDLFLGSGSTLIACEKTGRTCYGMEMDEHYCSVIIKRWQDFTGETAEIIEDVESEEHCEQSEGTAE